MNLNQAKKLAGIAPGDSVTGRDALSRAAKQCTKLAAKYHPDRNPNDKTAENTFRKLIEARDYFEKRTPHGCAVCGVTVGRGATHCRIHQKRNRTLPEGQPKPPQPKRNSNARVSVVGDPLALNGYYTASVQKTVAEWREAIGEPMLQRYFVPVAEAVISRDNSLALPFVAGQHWQAVFELGSAIAAVLNNTNTPDGWLLRLRGSIHTAANGAFLSTAEIRALIIREGGKPFTTAAITQALKRMKLATSKELARDWRESVMTKVG